MLDKPNTKILEEFFLTEGVDNPELLKKISKAWGEVHLRGKAELGEKNCIARDPYTWWVKEKSRSSCFLFIWSLPWIHNVLNQLMFLSKSLMNSNLASNDWKMKMRSYGRASIKSPVKRMTCSSTSIIRHNNSSRKQRWFRMRTRKEKK